MLWGTKSIFETKFASVPLNSSPLSLRFQVDHLFFIFQKVVFFHRKSAFFQGFPGCSNRIFIHTPNVKYGMNLTLWTLIDAGDKLSGTCDIWSRQKYLTISTVYHFCYVVGQLLFWHPILEMYIMSEEIFDATNTSKPCLNNSTVDRYGNAWRMGRIKRCPWKNKL